MLRSPEPTYAFAYFPEFNAAAHEHGGSARADLEARSHLTLLERALPRLAAAAHGPTALILTADHGQVTVDPATTVYVNLVLPELERMLLRAASGRPLAPAGSARDLFLHVREDSVSAAIAMLTDALAGRATVHRTQELLDDGILGPPPREALAPGWATSSSSRATARPSGGTSPIGSSSGSAATTAASSRPSCTSRSPRWRWRNRPSSLSVCDNPPSGCNRSQPTRVDRA